MDALSASLLWKVSPAQPELMAAWQCTGACHSPHLGMVCLPLLPVQANAPQDGVELLREHSKQDARNRALRL